MPDFDFTRPMSLALMLPSTVTSSRKLEPVTALPDWDLVWPMSARTDGAVPVGIADQHTHGDDEAGAVHAIKPDLDDLLSGHVCERNGNGISTNRDHAAIRRAAASDCAATGD